MTTETAKEKIGLELMTLYHEWLNDEQNLPDEDYAIKYGWGKGEKKHSDSFQSLKVFMDYFFAGRYLPGWVKAGFDEEIIYALHREGFLSYKFYSNWDARMRGKTSWYYINLKTAREIYKGAKGA